MFEVETNVLLCSNDLNTLQKTRKVLKKIEELMHGAGSGQRQMCFSAGMKLNVFRLRPDLLLTLVLYCSAVRIRSRLVAHSASIQ